MEKNDITPSKQLEHLSQAAAAISDQFGAEMSEFRGEITLALAPEVLEDAARELRDRFGFDTLLDLTSVDYWPEMQPRMILNYQLHSTSRNTVLRLRVPLNGSGLTIKTLERVYPNANWYERELWDLFGIRFDGHSDPRRIMMPEDWVGHPLRKDYPVGYEEVQFTFNGKDILVRKPRPQE